MRGLSGGERSRLAMAKIMLFPRNVLVLDEPTNHLDIPARETLEDALGAYEGTLHHVSHDRYFLDRICTRLLVIEGTHVEAHVGNYSDWRRRGDLEGPARGRSLAKPGRQRDRRSPSQATRRQPRPDPLGRDRGARRQAARARAAAAGAARGDAGGGCEQAGSRAAAVRADLAGDHAGDWQKLHALAERERELDALLARRIAEWEAASAAALNSVPSSSD